MPEERGSEEAAGSVPTAVVIDGNMIHRRLRSRGSDHGTAVEPCVTRPTLYFVMLNFPSPALKPRCAAPVAGLPVLRGHLHDPLVQGTTILRATGISPHEAPPRLGTDEP